MINQPKFYDVPNQEKLGKRVFDFYDHLDDVKPQFDKLKELEQKYPFFRVQAPTINYNGQIFEAYTRFNLDLEATLNNGSSKIIVDFNSGHNNMDLFVTPNRKTMNIEAQERMYCDSELGYNFIKQFIYQNKRAYAKELIEKFYIAKNKTATPEEIADVVNKETKILCDDADLMNQYYIQLNYDKIKKDYDLLIFDDHDQKHTSFRGWTGGYDPNYPEVFNRNHMKMKSKWLGGGFSSLERRINTLKQLFDELVDLSQFEIQDKKLEKIEFPDYGKIYSELAGSNYYREMIEFGKKLSKDTNISKKYDISIHMQGNNTPGVIYINEDNRVMFKTMFWEYGEYIGNSELHIPKELSKIKRNNNKSNIWIYDENNSMQLRDIDKELKDSKIVCMTKYFKKIEDAPKSLALCFDKVVKLNK